MEVENSERETKNAKDDINTNENIAENVAQNNNAPVFVFVETPTLEAPPPPSRGPDKLKL